MANDKKASLIIELKDQVSEGLAKIGGAFSSLKEHVLALSSMFAAIAGFIYKSVTAFNEQEQSVRRLDVAINNVKGTLPGATDRLVDLATALSKTTLFQDEAIISAQSMLATMGMTETQISMLTPRVLDLATAMGVDVTTAAMTLGKAIEMGSSAPLKRSGLVLDETAFKTHNFNGVIDTLNARLKGQAESAAKGSGSILLLSKAIGESTEDFGKYLAIALQPAVTWLARVVEWIDDLSPKTKLIGALVVIGTAAFTGLFAVLALILPVITGLGAAFGAIGTVFAAVATPVGLLIGALGGLVAAFFVVRENFLGLKDVLITEMNNIVEAWNKFVYAINLAMQGEFSAAIETGKQAIAMLTVDTIVNLTTIASNVATRFKTIREAIATSWAEALKRTQEWGKGTIKAVGDTQNEVLALEDKEVDARIKRAIKFEQDKQKVIRDSFDMIATLSTAHNRVLATIGKAAAIGIATRDTWVAANKALASAPPPWNFALAAGVVAVGMANVANIVGTPLAKGGVVLPKAGGTLATIGEGGRAEAVIPLDDPQAAEAIGGLGGIHLTINSQYFIGGPDGARELAVLLDRELFNLRRNNLSVAFDSL